MLAGSGAPFAPSASNVAMRCQRSAAAAARRGASRTAGRACSPQSAAPSRRHGPRRARLGTVVLTRDARARESVACALRGRRRHQRHDVPRLHAIRAVVAGAASQSRSVHTRVCRGGIRPRTAFLGPGPRVRRVVGLQLLRTVRVVEAHDALGRFVERLVPVHACRPAHHRNPSTCRLHVEREPRCRSRAVTAMLRRYRAWKRRRTRRRTRPTGPGARYANGPHEISADTFCRRDSSRQAGPASFERPPSGRDRASAVGPCPGESPGEKT